MVSPAPWPLTAGLVGVGSSAFAVRTALAALTVRTVRVPLAALPPSMEAYTLVQLTDIHVGPTIDRRFMVELVARVNALRADAVVITGDLVDGSRWPTSASTWRRSRGCARGTGCSS